MRTQTLKDDLLLIRRKGLLKQASGDHYVYYLLRGRVGNKELWIERYVEVERKFNLNYK